MSIATAKKPRQMPKGGRKGGSVFPRVALTDALQYATKLVSKTHTSMQPKDLILSGVVGAKSGTGEVRMSALKQYGFLKGNAKTGFSADELAKKVAAAPPDEVVPLYQQAMLRPTIFKKLFDTYHGDTVTKAKLKQRAADLNVHPDETDTCVDLYVSGMETAGLVTVDGDRIVHKAASDLSKTDTQVEERGQIEQGLPKLVSDQDGVENKPSDAVALGARSDAIVLPNGGPPNDPASALNQHGPRAVFNVNVTLDSSLDIEKLQKQLELLKRFGAI
jgi:hypothetical protein